jgi:prepilin-type N-terminal cleavage/methylation domain-containing protein
MNARGHHRRRSAGFTLIEMLAALSIAGVLVYCVYGAITAQASWRRKGDEIVERGQRFSSFEHDLASDLRGLLAPSHPDLVATEPIPANRLVVEPQAFQERFLDVRTDERPSPVRFLGTPATMTLELHRGNLRFDEQSIPQLVVWRCAVDRAEPVTLFHIGRRPKRFDVSNTGQLGIVRWSMSLEHLNSAPRSRGLDDLPSTSWSVCPTVRDWRLSYFDGTRWTDRWDSTELKSLPQAVQALCFGVDERPLPPVVIRIPTASGGGS